MWPDVVDLRDFYATPLGLVARRAIRKSIRGFWPEVSGMGVLGFGYATPYLRPFMGEAQRVVSVMPSRMGVLAWPDGNAQEPNLVTVAEEADLPLPDLSIDRIVMVHGLEYTENVRGLLREAWRVLSDGGRLLVVVPNRRSIWARADHTPFGHGHPYSVEQLNRALRQSMFTPVRERRALFVPPTRSRFWLATAPAWERLGTRWFAPLGGVGMVEATKQIYGAALADEKVRRRVYAPVPQGMAPAERADATWPTVG